jgi:hypothetical protein
MFCSRPVTINSSTDSTMKRRQLMPINHSA